LDSLHLKQQLGFKDWFEAVEESELCNSGDGCFVTDEEMALVMLCMELG